MRGDHDVDDRDVAPLRFDPCCAAICTPSERLSVIRTPAVQHGFTSMIEKRVQPRFRCAFTQAELPFVATAQPSGDPRARTCGGEPRVSGSRPAGRLVQLIPRMTSRFVRDCLRTCPRCQLRLAGQPSPVVALPQFVDRRATLVRATLVRWPKDAQRWRSLSLSWRSVGWAISISLLLTRGLTVLARLNRLTEQRRIEYSSRRSATEPLLWDAPPLNRA